VITSANDPQRTFTTCVWEDSDNSVNRDQRQLSRSTVSVARRGIFWRPPPNFTDHLPRVARTRILISARTEFVDAYRSVDFNISLLLRKMQQRITSQRSEKTSLARIQRMCSIKFEDFECVHILLYIYIYVLYIYIYIHTHIYFYICMYLLYYVTVCMTTF
jgi:hypothetical protein